MDLEFLCEELGLDRDQFSQFASLFLDVASTDLARMREALDLEDVVGVAQAAHSIKGAALTLELEWISSLAKSVETKAKSGAIEEIRTEMNTLALELEKLQASLQEQFPPKQEGFRQVEP